MIRIIQRVPEKYRQDFITDQTSLIKKRVELFFSFVVGVYFFTTIVSWLIDPDAYKALEAGIGIALLVAGGIFLYFNHRSSTMKAARVNAYVFTLVLLVLSVRLGVAYEDSVESSSAFFMFLLFLVGFTIPWTPCEVGVISFAHAAAFSVNVFLVNNLYRGTGIYMSFRDYLEGLVPLFIAAGLCYVISREEIKRELDNFVLFKEIEENEGQMSKELQLATNVHRSLIPRPLSTEKLDIFPTYLPAYYMGGDYARYNFIDEGKLIFIMADVTGHGVPAALLVNRLHAEFERLSKEGAEPGYLLNELNIFIKDDFESMNIYLSAFCGMIDLDSGRLLYSNHGHIPQYLYRASGGDIVEMTSQTCLLGLSLCRDDICQDEVGLEGGDRILLFTDGVTEAADREGAEFGAEKVKKILVKEHAGTPSDINSAIMGELQSFGRMPFKDDIFILSIGIK
ncbi:MAG: SpoIIE family protein phosphatase [Candidatus Omnitrophica bacterium]|nr:SpoIIE family protein phosphatase [Candidatus Omnitrophota bacterium]